MHSQVLSVGAIHRRNLELALRPAHFQLHRRTHAQMQPLRHAFTHRQLIRARIRPPLALRHLVARRRRIGPTQRGALQHSPRKMLPLQLLQRLAIDRNKPSRHHRHQVECLAHSLLVLEEVLHARNLAGRDVHQEDIRQLGRSRLAQIPQQRRLHQEDRQNQHHARTQCSHHRRRLVSRPIQVRQPVTHRRGQPQPDAIEKEAQRPQRNPRQHQQNHQRNRKQHGKPRAHLGGVRKRPRNPAQRQHHHNRNPKL